MPKTISTISLLFLMCFLLFNCSSDNENGDNEQENNIVGVYKISSYTLDNSFDINQDGISSHDFIAETNCFENETFVLNKNGIGEKINGSRLEFLVANPNDYTMECLTNTHAETITWSLEDNALTIQSVYQEFVATFDGNTITVSANEDILVQALFGDSFTANKTIVYTKQ